MGPLVPLPFGPVVLWSVVRWYLVRFALCSEALPNRPKHGSTENRITERCSHLHLLTLDTRHSTLLPVAQVYQLLLGSDPNRVMDYTIISDTPTPPNQALSSQGRPFG